ncbi:PAS domain-containing sensor histidine kinase [Gemmatimonas sp.]|uniref:sensor histidine kinase n=1 Tax=Gemmatimonas sp. TaxID=1962908 RepID=UPI00286AEC28|nr:PAS domain-containing sensor histidine kinase [Gemmatimonas sp.]
MPHALAALRDSNARYRVLADTMLHGVVHQAVDGRIIAMNPAAERILGQSRAEMLGSTSEHAEQHTVREDGSVFPAAEHPSMRALATGVAVRGVIMGVYNPRERQRRWICIDAVPIMQADAPTPVEVYTVFEDITERRATELALKARDAHFRLLVEHMPDLYLRTNLHTGHYEYVSPASMKMFGFSAEQMMQKDFVHLLDMVYEDDRPAVIAAIERLTRDGRAESEFRSLSSSGDLRWFWSIMTLVPDEQGAPMYRDTFVREITDRKRIELELSDAVDQKNRFIATLAHELRNPLAPLGNVVALLQDPISPARLLWCRDIIERQVTQMGRLLDDLLDLSRITHGKITLQREQVTLTAMLERGIEMARPAIEARRHNLVVDVPSERMHVYGDIVRLAQVCCNLLTNAAKYTDAGGIITLRILRDGVHAVIEIEDTGIGIAEADLERVFGMFSQVDTTRTRSGDGLGIGLSLVKGIVELHGGEVEARSAGLGHGSTFSVRLPLAM